MTKQRIDIVGSVNLDLVARAESLPAPGETVTGAMLAQYPGGKGANQALAAARLGADVGLVARVGADAHADAALALLVEGEVDLTRCHRDSRPTGVALIAVDAAGENQIIVASGANEALAPADLPDTFEGSVICQLEVPVEAVLAARERCKGLFCLNVAPALTVPASLLESAGLIVANETEAAFYGDEIVHAGPGMVALTLGARGARLFEAGRLVAEVAPPAVDVVDTTGAGDTFVGALCVALGEGKPHEAALAFACAASALAVTRAGAQPALPHRADVETMLATEAS